MTFRAGYLFLLLFPILFQQACSPLQLPQDRQSPVEIKTVSDLRIDTQDNVVYLTFSNPFYGTTFPMYADSNDLTIRIFHKTTAVSGENSKVIMLKASDFIDSSIIRFRLFTKEDASAYYSKGIHYFSVAGSYGYFEGNASNTLTIPTESEYFNEIKKSFGNIKPVTKYHVALYNCLSGQNPAQMIVEAKDYLDSVSYGLLDFTIKNNDTVLYSGANLTEIASLVKKTDVYDDVAFLLSSSNIAPYFNRYAVLPGGFASENYFVLTSMSSYVFIHEMLHNVKETQFDDLYNGYSRIEPPYVNSLAGTVFGDQYASYFPKIFRAFLGWDTLRMCMVLAGADTVLTVKPVTSHNKVCQCIWLGFDNNGLSHCMSLELISNSTPYRKWQGEGLRVFEFYLKSEKSLQYLHLFPLSENGEESPVSERVFCLQSPKWNNDAGIKPEWYSVYTQRGITVQVLKEYGNFDSMTVKVSRLH